MSRSKININGVTREMTAEELNEYKNMVAVVAQNVPEATPAEKRMDEIEAALIELAAMIAGGGD